MQDFISTYLARILAVWVAALASWLLAKYSITIEDAAQKALVEHLVGVIIPLFMTLYAIGHRFLSKGTNPGDAASSHLAKREAHETKALKR